MIHQLLESQISEASFAECWAKENPPYVPFLNSTSEKLAAKAPHHILDLSCSIKSDGTDRIRLDGTMTTSDGDQSFYVELVWMPATGNFRGKASLWSRDPESVASEGDAGQQAVIGDEPLVPVFVPTLVSVLLHSEKKKGAPLSECEVIEIRDRAICIAMRVSMATMMEKQRGYSDINPENCWAEWRDVREDLNQP